MTHFAYVRLLDTQWQLAPRSSSYVHSFKANHFDLDQNFSLATFLTTPPDPATPKTGHTFFTSGLYSRVSNNRTNYYYIYKNPFHMVIRYGQFDAVKLMLNNQFKAFNINFAQNQPIQIGLEEIEKL